MQRLILTEELRRKLKQPLGILVEGKKDETMNQLKRIIEETKPRKIICIGDIVSRNTFQFSMPVDVKIIDNKAMRKEIEDFKFSVKRTFYINNPAGTIELLAWQAIKEAIRIKDVLISVNGEEDLLTLVAILEAPLESVVIYGQPKKGIVIVKVNEEKRNEVKSIIDSMIVE